MLSSSFINIPRVPTPSLSLIPVLQSRLCFAQNMIICNLIWSFVEVEHFAILAYI